MAGKPKPHHMAASKSKPKKKSPNWKIVAGKMKKKCASWKRKALERRNEIKALKSSLAREKLGRNKLRGSCPGQSGGDAPTRVRHQRFGLDAMLLAVAMHITNNVGLRATAKSLCLAMGLWGPGARSVSATTVRNWSLRVGLYFLTRRPPAGRYVLIADESGLKTSSVFFLAFMMLGKVT